MPVPELKSPFDPVIEPDTGDLDEILHVTDALYQQLVDQAYATRARVSSPDPALQAAGAAVVHAEARLLDMRRFDDWLRLFTRDCIYWVPASADPVDPRTATSIHLDDRRRLRDRIALMKTGHLHAQTPPSRTCRVLGNVEVWRGEADPRQIIVRSNLTIWTYRLQTTRPHIGAQEHVLVPDPDGEGYLIRYKTLQLLDCDGPQGNITFML